MLCIGAAPLGCQGQAWVPEKAEGSFSTIYTYLAVKGHFSTDGNKLFVGAARDQSVTFDFEYGLTNKLALEFSIPIVAARYADVVPSSDFLRTEFNQAIQILGPAFYRSPFLDDLSYHAAVQDIRINLRYQVRASPLVLTPFFTFVTPSHSYPFVGEASPGRNLREYQFGVNVGRRLNPFLANAYSQGQFSFTVPEEAAGLRTYRTNLSLELGYFLTRSLTVRGLGSWQHTLVGLRFPQDVTSPELALTHERLLKANYWHAGGGVSYSVTPKTVIFADVVTFLTGRDTHFGSGISVGVSRSFQREHHPAQSSVVPSQFIYSASRAH
jgi:hypothetical protein